MLLLFHGHWGGSVRRKLAGDWTGGSRTASLTCPLSWRGSWDPAIRWNLILTQEHFTDLSRRVASCVMAQDLKRARWKVPVLQKAGLWIVRASLCRFLCRGSLMPPRCKAGAEGSTSQRRECRVSALRLPLPGSPTAAFPELSVRVFTSSIPAFLTCRWFCARPLPLPLPSPLLVWVLSGGLPSWKMGICLSLPLLPPCLPSRHPGGFACLSRTGRPAAWIPCLSLELIIYFDMRHIPFIGS